MGTRNLTAVMAEGEYKIAQYGQWDGHPSGVGITILGFLSEAGNIDKLRAALSKVRFIDLKGRDKDFVESYNANAPKLLGDPDNRTPEQKHWFSTYSSRDIAGEILGAVSSSSDNEILLRNNIGFAGNSLFCEYAYIIDLDAEIFEVYEGFNQEKVIEGRFISSSEDAEKSEGYEPVKLIKSYKLSELPSEAAFLTDLEPDEEDEDAA